MELFAVILVVGVLPDFIGGTCISKNDSVKEDFKIFDENQIADFDYAQFSKSKTIDCCAHNVSRILWYFWNKQYPEWRLFPWQPYCSICDNRPKLEDNNQTLVLMETGNGDSGIYRCIAMSENNSIAEHNTTIEVFSCTERQTPLYIAPQDKYASIGDTVTFSCSGDFGCTIDKFRQVEWYDENYDFINNSRYSNSYAEKYGKTYVEAKLTITDTRESDFNKTFICLVSSTSDYQYFEVHIFKKRTIVTITNTTTTKKMHIPAGVIVAVIASGIVMVIVLLLLLFRPRVMLFILSRIPYGHLTDKGSKHYHALILHEDEYEDRKLAEQIKTRLKKDTYSVKMSSHVLGGQDVLGALGDFSQNSASLIIIYPTKACSEIFPTEISSVQYKFKPGLITVIKQRGIENRVQALEDRGLKKITWPDKGVFSLFEETNFYSKLKLRMPRRSSRNTKCCTCCRSNTSAYSEHISEQSYSTKF
ncbi:uncharacterized protein [Mytilus edulis]|uniref:uncharacterized protein n=1 Tax=Mytilus edulis TaxID=6550 RepID=UPI0039EF6671